LIFARERDVEKRRRVDESRVDQGRQSRLAVQLDPERDESGRLLSQSINAIMHFLMMRHTNTVQYTVQ
jgi:hypothetical protein